MRFFARRVVTPSIACAVALLLLLPSFSVLGPHGFVGAPSRVQSASAQLPPLSTPTALSSYKSLGAADPSMSVLVSVAIPLRNLPLLSSLVKESSDPSSAGFRHFLTYGQVSQMFLPTQAQYQSVLDYLTLKGFTVVSSSLNSMITVRGTAAQVTQSLGQGVDLYTNGTYSYYQTTGPSTLPGAYSFASNSTGLLMRPDLIRSGGAASGAIPSANVTFTEGGQASSLLRTVYNSTGLLSKGINGTGYTVGLLDFYGYPLVAQDLAQFDSTYGYPAPPSFKVSPIGPYNPNLGSALGWDGEIDLDVQSSHAMAPGANISPLRSERRALPLGGSGGGSPGREGERRLPELRAPRVGVLRVRSDFLPVQLGLRRRLLHARLRHGHDLPRFLRRRRRERLQRRTRGRGGVPKLLSVRYRARRDEHLHLHDRERDAELQPDGVVEHWVRPLLRQRGRERRRRKRDGAHTLVPVVPEGARFVPRRADGPRPLA